MGKNGTKIIKLFLRQFFLILFLQFVCTGVQAQSRKVKQAERNYEKVLKKEQQAYDKKRKATIKHRYAIQSQDVKERMKETEKRSQKYGRKSKDPWLKNLFNKNKKRKKRKRKPR